MLLRRCASQPLLSDPLPPIDSAGLMLSLADTALSSSPAALSRGTAAAAAGSPQQPLMRGDRCATTVTLAPDALRQLACAVRLAGVPRVLRLSAEIHPAGRRADTPRADVLLLGCHGYLLLHKHCGTRQLWEHERIEMSCHPPRNLRRRCPCMGSAAMLAAAAEMSTSNTILHAQNPNGREAVTKCSCEIANRQAVPRWACV